MTRNFPTARQLLFSYLKFLGIGFVYVVSDMEWEKGRKNLKPVGKVGVKDKTGLERLRCISRSIQEVTGRKVRLRQVWVMPTFAPYRVEKLVHCLHNYFRTDKFKGASGWTEFFAQYNVFAGAIVLCLGMYFQAGPITVMAVAAAVFHPVPFDLCFTVTLISIFQFTTLYGFFCAFKWALWQTVALLVLIFGHS